MVSEHCGEDRDRHVEALVLPVKMGRALITAAPNVMVCAGLGSCVALAFYERHKKIGGLAHIMLPDSSIFRSRFSGHGLQDLSSKGGEAQSAKGSTTGTNTPVNLLPPSPHLWSVYQCADTAIAALLEGMLGNGVTPQELVAKIAGGARMFSSYENSAADRSIGEHNVLAVKRILTMKRIRLIGAHTGGTCGRNVQFHLDSGRLIVKRIGMEDEEI